MLAGVVIAQLVSCDLQMDEVQVGEKRFAAETAKASSGVAVHVGGAAQMVAVVLWQQHHAVGRAYVLLEGEQSATRRHERVAVVSAAGALVGVVRVLVVVARAWPGRWPAERAPWRWPQGRGCTLIAHRGFGATWRRLGVAENTLCAFEAGFAQGLRWAEFDVQLTRDLVPMLFHDVTMTVALAEEEKPLKIATKEIEAQQLPRLAFRPPALPLARRRSASQVLLPTHRARLGTAARYAVHDDFPTLERVLRRAPRGMGFNVELKYAEWRAEEGYYVDRGAYLDAVLAVVSAHAGPRELVFSSFDPDLCWLAKQKQAQYPVLFLTEGGQVTTEDPRKDSLEAALHWTLFAGLDGLVADVESVLPRRPEVVPAARARGLLFFTYGGLNNDPAIVRQQRDLGVDAVITDRWQVQEAIKG